MSNHVTTAPGPAGARGRRDRTHYLYLAVIAAVLLGIAVGLAAPDFALRLEPLGEGLSRSSR